MRQNQVYSNFKSSPMRYNLILHPLLFTVYAVLAIFANNLTNTQLSGLRSLFFALLGSIFIFAVLRLLLRNGIKAGLITSAVIALLFFYGHIETVSIQIPFLGSFISQPLVLIPLLVGLMTTWSYWVLKKLQKPQLISNYLNWVSVILIIFPVYQIWSFNRHQNAVKPWEDRYIQLALQSGGFDEIQIIAPQESNKPKPDIYYLVLDAYTRADILDELYDYDSSEFTDYLQERGFYLADKSQANYTDTSFSIASSLNMLHINSLPDYLYENAGEVEASSVNEVSSQLIKDNRLANILKQNGYSFIAFDSGYEQTRIPSADIYMTPPQTGVSGTEFLFDMMFFDTTLGRVYMKLRGEEFRPLQALFDAHRERILYTLDNLPNYAKRDGNYFVYAHIISPHVPYVFGPNGETIHGTDPYTLLDNHPGHEKNVELYAGQVNYLNKLLMQTIDEILVNSETTPIIILQGDHSSKVFSGPDPDPITRRKLLLPVLNAYLLPDGGNTKLYASITPVNSFRVVLNHYFGTQIELLPDESFLLKSLKDRVHFCQANTPNCIQ